MAAVTDYVTSAYKRIWEVLEARAEFTAIFKVNNRIKLVATDAADDKSYPFKESKSDADFPEAVLTLGEFSDTGYTLTGNYAHQPGFNPNTQPWTERITQEFVLTLTMPDLRVRKLSLAERETMRALLLGGPRFEREWIRSWGPVRGTRLIGKSGEAAGSDRLQSVLRVPVLMEFKGQTLLT